MTSWTGSAPDALALRFTYGHAAAAPGLTRALELLLALDSSPGQARGLLWPVGAHGASSLIAAELWDFESWHALAVGQVRAAHDTGAFAHLQFALNLLAIAHLLTGELAAAASLLDEDRLIADATGNPRSQSPRRRSRPGGARSRRRPR